jgi:hypothetical protein
MKNVRRVAIALALAAMALRALIPAGWMPNPHGMGETAFIICGMDAMVDMPGMNMPGMDMSDMDMTKNVNSDIGQQAPAGHSDDGHQHEACPFAAAPHLAAPLLAAMFQPPALAEKGGRHLFRVRLAFGPAHYAPQSPRAPPHLA